MKTPPIILVPGWWLGAWAWDEVAAQLRAEGLDVTAITLPGLEAAGSDRASVTLDDHVDAICEAIEAAARPVVLVLHSASGFTGYAASDRIPERIAAIVYVDSAPGKGAMAAEFEGLEKPLPPLDELAQSENVDGLSEEQLARFRDRAVPMPGSVMRGSVELTTDARRDIPSTIVATGMSSAEYQAALPQGWPFLAGVSELRRLTWVDLPTSHWPMWSRPTDLAAIIADVARQAALTRA